LSDEPFKRAVPVFSNTRCRCHRSVLGATPSALMLTILAGLATWEREIMLERQREGIAKAKADGKYKGRPASIDAAEIRRLTATMGPAAIAKQLGVARSTVYRLLEQPAAGTQH
jgi:DNA invertase Pin-like site-specific DNA recombinase